MSTVTQYEVGALLEEAGARPRGNQHDCPKCGGLRTITHTAECFYCHKCQWDGNSVTLQKELGIYQRIPSAEYRELCRRRERGHEAALRLCAQAHARQLELRDDLRILGRLEQRAHEMGADDPNTWEILSTVYERRPAIERDLDVLESGSAKDIFQAVR